LFDGGKCIGVDDDEVFAESFALGADFALVIDDGGLPGEDEIVVGSDLIDGDDGNGMSFGVGCEDVDVFVLFTEDKGGC